MLKAKAQKNMMYAQECAKLFAEISTGDYSNSGERKRLAGVLEKLAAMMDDTRTALDDLENE